MMSRTRTALMIALAATLTLLGCQENRKKTVMPPPKYATADLRAVPEYLKGTLLEGTDVLDAQPFPVSGFGLVANLDNTGGGPYPNRLRDYMIRTMVNRGIGRPTMPEFRHLLPEDMLASRRFSIVEVIGMIPPGARKDQEMDLLVRALPNSDTSSLARGKLFQTELFVNGTRDFDPTGSVNVLARGGGAVFVNPVHAIDIGNSTPGQLSSLRQGVVMNGARAGVDRAIRLQLRRPQRSTARRIEAIINRRFQHEADKPRKDSLTGFTVAEAQDEGIIHLYVPRMYKRDWQRFVGVVQHLYLNQSAGFLATKAQELVEAAQQPDAPLENICYALEAIGQPALPFLSELINHSDPVVGYAAARSAALIGDPSAPRALLRIAQTPDHPSQVYAVETLGALPTTPEVNQMLRNLLSSNQTLVRVEAYKVLAAAGDSSVYTRVVGPSEHEQKFVLDIIASDGPPLIHASRTGVPRLAIFGNRPSLELPVMFTAMANNFSVSSVPGKETVTLFYRGPGLEEPLTVNSRPDIAEVIARLGGEGPIDQERFDFSYGDVVAVVQAMASQKKITAGFGGERVASAFVLQDPATIEDTVESAPPITTDSTGRPQEVEPAAERDAASSAAY